MTYTATNGDYVENSLFLNENTEIPHESDFTTNNFNIKYTNFVKNNNRTPTVLLLGLIQEKQFIKYCDSIEAYKSVGKNFSFVDNEIKFCGLSVLFVKRESYFEVI